MANETYDYYLGTGSGEMSMTLQFQDDEDVLLELKEDWMGRGKHRYRLYGKHERFSDSYGWLRIHQVKDLSSSTPETEIEASEVDLSKLELELIYEYIKLAPAPVLYHPDDALPTMAPLGYATWNDSFDLLLMPLSLLIEDYYYLEESLEQKNPPDPTFMEHYSFLVPTLDKVKFEKRDEE